MLTDPHTRSSSLLKETEASLQSGFLVLIRAILGQQSLDAVEELILQGRTLDALDLIIPSVAAFADQVSSGFVTSGSDTAASIALLTNSPVSFNQTSAPAVNFMAENRSRIIAQFTQDQRRATSRAVGASIINGTARQQAAALRGSIGLTELQVLALEKFRTNLANLSRDALERQLRDRGLEAAVRRAITTDTPLTLAQIESMVERYRQRLLIFRARVVAQSEALRVVNAGNLSMFQQAVDLGLLDGTSIQRRWKTAGDGNVRNSHASMDGQKRGLNEPFISGAGARLRFPGDPNGGLAETINCRCVVETKFDKA